MGSADFGNQAGGMGPADRPGAYRQPVYGNPPQYGQPGPYGRVGRKTNSLAIASLCCGIGMVLAGIFAGIAAIVLGILAISQIRQTGEGGRGMAIVGIVLGFIAIIATVLLFIFLLVMANGLSNNTATF